MGIKSFVNKIVTDWLTQDRPPTEFPMCDFDRIRYELRPCDVLLTEGRSHVSDIIKYATQSAWSHSALYVGRIHDIEDPVVRNKAMEYFEGPPDTQLLIEGVLGRGTVVTPLNFYRPDHIRICRPRGLTPNDANRIINYAVSRLGSDYDVRQTVDLARFLLPWSVLPRGWRNTLFNDNSQSTRTICSTMIAEAFSSVHFPILPHIRKNTESGLEFFHRNPRLYTPRDFDYSPYFEIIKYPFVGLDEQPAYRKLPWNKDGVVIRGNERPVKDDVEDKNAKYD